MEKLMVAQFNADERLVAGIDSVLKSYFNKILREHNDEITDGEYMTEILSENIYDDVISVQQLVDTVFHFPAICFYIERAYEESKNTAIYFENIQVRFAVFTDGSNGATIIKRYLSVLREVLHTYYKSIDQCVFSIGGHQRRYYRPLKYQSDDLRIAELDIQFVVEVRK
jgi:hypothetical protein